MQRSIDLRSDTVTHPTPAMRRAMAEAELGDDVFGDDPTVNALEERAAELLGKEAGLFVSSGSQGNLVSLMAHLARGQEAIAAYESHIVSDEAAGHAVVVGASVRTLHSGPDGTMDLAEIAGSFRDPTDPHEPITGLVSIENTHAHSGARPLTAAYTRAVADVAHAHGVPLHVDGARFWNAVVALGADPLDLAGPADSVSFCLSKGLACPVGSVVVGSRDFIWRARRARKLLGGGMRQVGVLAAAGLVALSDGPDGTIARLADDHANARRLAEGLADLDGIESPGGIAQPAPGRLDPGRIATNFVVFRVARDRAAFLAALEARGVLMVAYPHGTIRAVTHYGIDVADVDATVAAVRDALAATAAVAAAARAGSRDARAPNRPSRPALPASGTAPHAAHERDPGDPVSETTLTRPQTTLTRPAPAADAGPLDERFWDLVEERVVRQVTTYPHLATFLGIHSQDGRLPSGERDAVEGEIADERAHLAAIGGLDDAGLSPSVRFERDLQAHVVRRALFDLEVHRVWERRGTAMDVAGDGLFALFARDFAPLDERLDSMASRLEGIPAFLAASRSRLTATPVRTWQQLEIESAEDMPGLYAEIAAAGAGVLAEPESRRLRAAAERATVATVEYADWVRSTLSAATDGWALGRERFDELVGLRAFDGLDSDEILAIGEEQLRLNSERRVATAREIDPSATEAEVVDRMKSDHPASFAEALEEYRGYTARARAYLVAHDIVTVPDDERLDVIPTPAYLRNVIPFAAYFEPPKFDPSPSGIYVVTPSVGDDPNAMREHNRSSMSNTSVHEAYPGHHLQLSVAGRHPSLVRLLVDAPEFVEGWGMYSEQMMREEGFDDAPRFWLNVHTDAIWRACRIVLDVRMHRGELTVDEATRFLVERTSFEEANARAEVLRYTYTPTYQLSYLLGKVLLLQLREDERRRLGPAFSLRGFHDTLLRNGSFPISFHRRLLDAAAAGAGWALTVPEAAPGGRI